MPAKSAGGGATKTAKKATKKTTKQATKKPATKTTAKKATKKSTAKAKVTKPAAKKPASGGKLRVRQVRSGIGRRRDFRRTLRALGLKHHQDEVIVTRSPAIDGMLSKVRHLIRVTPEE